MNLQTYPEDFTTKLPKMEKWTLHWTELSAPTDNISKLFTALV